MNKYDLDTPCLVIDLDTLDENLEKMQARATAAGKNLRPHAKTHKCSTLAQRQIDKGAIGVCVAKVSEARPLVEAGVKGILITGAPAAEKKAEQAVCLFQRSPDLMVTVDHPRNIDLLEKYLSAPPSPSGLKPGLKMGVLVDIDVGSRRTGVPADGAHALARRVMASSFLTLKGIQAYAGHVQHIKGYEERKKASTGSLKQATEVFDRLRREAPSCTLFSASGTGSSDIDLNIPEQTELQVGSYALMDADYGAIESVESEALLSLYRPALSLLTTVVNVSHETHVTVDAGLKSLYRDGGRPVVTSRGFEGLVYDWFGDEYGRLSPGAEPGPLPRLGGVLELIVSHCDPTVNQFDRFYITREDEVVDSWPIDLRGKSQ